MVEMMSCSANLLQNNRKMCKGREAFDIHNTIRHHMPSSTCDQLNVAQFSLRKNWLGSKGRTTVKKYPWADKIIQSGDKVPETYFNVLAKGDEKAEIEFQSFLHRKYPNEMK